jgi:glycosyltransferase involved in cell wall biosynthesis
VAHADGRVTIRGGVPVLEPDADRATPLRVLHCIASMEGGGAERQLAYLAGELPALGWDVHVALLRGGPNLARLERTGATLHWLRAANNHDPRVPLQLARLMRALRADIVQTWLLQMDVAAGASAAWLRVPFVMTERVCEDAYPRGVKTALRRTIGRAARAIVSNSAGGDRYWTHLPAGGPMRIIVANGLPLEEIAATPPADLTAYGLRPDDRLVLYAGRFSAQKNLPCLVDALAGVSSERVRVLLCGEGPDRDEIAVLVDSRGLADRVLLPGYVDNLWGLMKRADVFVSISTFEGHPNTVLEALACGCRLVVSDIDAHRSFLDADVAEFVDPGDFGSVRAGLVKMLEMDEARAAAVSVRARSRATRWAIHEIARQYDEVYRRLLIPGFTCVDEGGAAFRQPGGPAEAGPHSHHE